MASLKQIATYTAYAIGTGCTGIVALAVWVGVTQGPTPRITPKAQATPVATPVATPQAQSPKLKAMQAHIQRENAKDDTAMDGEITVAESKRYKAIADRNALEANYRRATPVPKAQATPVATPVATPQAPKGGNFTNDLPQFTIPRACDAFDNTLADGSGKFGSRASDYFDASFTQSAVDQACSNSKMGKWYVNGRLTTQDKYNAHHAAQ